MAHSVLVEAIEVARARWQQTEPAPTPRLSARQQERARRQAALLAQAEAVAARRWGTDPAPVAARAAEAPPMRPARERLLHDRWWESAPHYRPYVLFDRTGSTLRCPVCGSAGHWEPVGDVERRTAFAFVCHHLDLVDDGLAAVLIALDSIAGCMPAGDESAPA